jgi:hypothetical protein
MCLYVAVLLTMILAGAVRAQTGNVVTGQYNNSRTAANIYETTLKPSNVSASTFMPNHFTFTV